MWTDKKLAGRALKTRSLSQDSITLRDQEFMLDSATARTIKQSISTKDLSSIAQVLNNEQATTGISRSPAKETSDEPKSIHDSISASSGRQNWSIKESAEDDPSIGSIKGDSVSATIADYNRKHRATFSDDQSNVAAQSAVDGDLSPRTDNLSTKINFYANTGSTSGSAIARQNCDFISANIDAFDIIEESTVSSCEDIRPVSKRSHRSKVRPSERQPRRSSALEQALELDDLLFEAAYQIEPIILRGDGNLTIFGLSNSFSSDFPPALIGRVSKEEFNRTMLRINTFLRDQQSLSAKVLFIGGLCCCCSLGFSLVWPSIALKKRSKMSLEKILTSENNRLYSKLGLYWRLAEQRCYSNHAFVEYVLKIEFTPKINIYLPD